jgi:hypothetical protein
MKPLETHNQPGRIGQALAMAVAVAALGWVAWTLWTGNRSWDTSPETAEVPDAEPAVASAIPPDFPRPGMPGYRQPPAGMATVGTPPGARPMPSPATPAAARQLDAASLGAEIQRLREALLTAADGRGRQRLIQEFGELVATAIGQLGADAVAEELVRLLGAGFEDIDFRLPFQPGFDGRMETVPNWRSLLLDGLAATASPVAADFVRNHVLDQPRTTADWAMGLKVVWEASEQQRDDPYFSAKLAEMLRNPTWTQQPTGALLESFDFVVAQHNKDLVPDMVRFLEGETDSGTPFAAAIVLQRMASADPSVAATVVRETTGVQLDAEVAKSRATIVAKLDPTSEAHLTVIRDYLADPGVSADEAEYFLRVFPQVNEIITPNIASTQYPDTRETLARKQQAGLALFEAWAADPAFAAQGSAIEESVARLTEVVEAARRAGIL